MSIAINFKLYTAMRNHVLVNNTRPATHFIEVSSYATGGHLPFGPVNPHRGHSFSHCRPIAELPYELADTARANCRTVAVFKIRSSKVWEMKVFTDALVETIDAMNRFPRDFAWQHPDGRIEHIETIYSQIKLHR